MIYDKVKKFRRIMKSQGFATASRRTFSHLKKSEEENSPNPIFQTKKTDVIGFYEQILGHDHGSLEELKKTNPSDKTIQWVIPDFGFGSGGHLNIFRFMNMLSSRGFKQNLVIVPPYSWKSAEQAKLSLCEWYLSLDAEVSLGIDGFKPSHYTIATGWQTAYWVAKYHGTHKRFYFIQDFEPFFSPISSDYFIAENTYRLGLKGITSGSWLKEKLSTEYGMECEDISFSFERDLYKPEPRKESPNFNILFYSRHTTKRRLFELGLLALKKVCADHPEAAVIFAGGDVSGYEIPFHHLNAGELTLKELPSLYSQCDLAVVLSGTNLSLLPLELAACNCPVVMNNSPSANWLLPDDAAYYADLEPGHLARTISDAINDPVERRKRTQKAQKIALDSSWEKEADTLVNILTKSTS